MLVGLMSSGEFLLQICSFRDMSWLTIDSACIQGRPEAISR